MKQPQDHEKHNKIDFESQQNLRIAPCHCQFGKHGNPESFQQCLEWSANLSVRNEQVENFEPGYEQVEVFTERFWIISDPGGAWFVL